MGDRANIFLVDQRKPGDLRGIYLYTHWAGEEWPEALRQALRFGKGRWGDSQYLARIITSRVFADLVNSETGGGLGTQIGDNERGRPVIICDLTANQVAWAAEGYERNPQMWYGHTPFEDYVAQRITGYVRP